MEAKEKAKELVEKFKNAPDEKGFISLNKWRHKQCALLAVDEILQLDIYWTSQELLKSDTSLNINGTQEFWIEVKQEIKKL